MTPENFCYWLQGLFELNPDKKELSEVQVQVIKDHLALIFRKETPNRVAYIPQFSYAKEMIDSPAPSNIACCTKRKLCNIDQPLEWQLLYDDLKHLPECSC